RFVPDRRVGRALRALGNRSEGRRASVGDQALVPQHGPHLVDVRVRRGEDQIGRLQAVGREGLAHLADVLQQGVQRGAEGRLVARLDRRLQLVVERVEGGQVLLGHVQLTLAHQADDHWAPPGFCGHWACWGFSCWCGWAVGVPWFSSVGAGPWPSSALSRSSSMSTPGPAPIRSSSAWMSSFGPEKSSRAPDASSSSIAPARAFIVSVFSSARWIARPTSPISSEMPENASLLLVWASAAV